MEHKWYILNVMAGQENKIADNIKNVAKNEMSQFISDVLVPCKKIVKIKKGQKVLEDQKLFPGYVFLKADIQSDVSNIASTIPKAMGFLGPKNRPEAVSEKKMEEIFSIVTNDDADSGKNHIYEIGEVLNVIEGPFDSFSGAVEEFDNEKQRVKISILIFGRATSVDLDVSQVEKVS
jgi:transcriptional antiterminator NusG